MRANIPQANIRNFCIIAHIDHGKSTLADRMLEITQTVSRRQMRSQLMDMLDLEREHGITIKAKAVRMTYESLDQEKFQLNLIDTPGHVDFSYEVSRALAACEGAVLLVDASQGIEAQTIANTYMAMELDLEIIPVVNKIDMATARTEAVIGEISEILGYDEPDILAISAKTGVGVLDVLEAIRDRIPPPPGVRSKSLRALVFDSSYDPHRGVMAYVRVVDGSVSAHDSIHLSGTKKQGEALEVGIFSPEFTPVDSLFPGEVGYIGTGLKDVHDCPVGDTIIKAGDVSSNALPGYKPAKPMVFAGFYTEDPGDYYGLRSALEKLRLSDSALVFTPEDSGALGFGFRVGFLGLLHMGIVRERLEREYDLALVTTNPSVQYRVETVDGETIEVDGPGNMPDRGRVAEVREPWADLSIVAPSEYIGAVMELVRQSRGEHGTIEYLEPKRVLLTFKTPLSELLIDFFDRLKSVSRGYASMDYSVTEYRLTDVVRIDILVNGNVVDALSTVANRTNSQKIGRELVQRLRKLIPRQMFQVAVQAAIDGKIIARETVPAVRKDVLAKCYGGDVTRKRKLLERQREGKKRMKRLGNVEIPQEAFTAVLGR